MHYQWQTSLPQLWFTTHFSWGAVHAQSDTKIFSTQLIFFEISWFIWRDSRDRIQKWVFEITWFKWLFHQTYKCDQNNFWWTRNLTSYPILCASYTVPSCLCWVQWPVENVTRVTQLCDSRDIVAHWTQIHTCIWLLKKQILIFQMKNSRRSYKSNNF